MAGLVTNGYDGWEISEAETVALPDVFRVTLKLLVPLTSAALAGNAALRSLEVIEIVSLVFTTFQFASTALTVTLKAAPAVCDMGDPVLPLAVPGAAVSPGTSSCKLAKAPGPTTTFDEVVPVNEPPAKLIVMVSATL